MFEVYKQGYGRAAVRTVEQLWGHEEIKRAPPVWNEADNYPRIRREDKF